MAAEKNLEFFVAPVRLPKIQESEKFTINLKDSELGWKPGSMLDVVTDKKMIR